jgi:hypothetical protein
MKISAIGVGGVALVLTLAAPAGAVGVTPAGTSATFDVSGTWSITPPGGLDMGPVPIRPGPPGQTLEGQIDPPSLDPFVLEGLAASTWAVTGSFLGEVQHFDPDTVTPYAIGIDVSATLDGPEAPPPFSYSETFVTDPISLSIVKDVVVDFVLAETTEPERQAAFDAVTGFIADAGDGDGAAVTLPEGGELFFAWSNFATTANSASGDFEASYTPPPLLVLDDAQASFLLDEEGPEPGTMSGTYSIGLSIAPAPVPVPAALPLMALALGGLWGLRRRR